MVEVRELRVVVCSDWFGSVIVSIVTSLLEIRNRSSACSVKKPKENEQEQKSDQGL